MVVINNSKYIMNIFGNKGEGKNEKDRRIYCQNELEDEYIVLPAGKRTEEVNEVISLSETAGFIYIHAESGRRH